MIWKTRPRRRAGGNGSLSPDIRGSRFEGCCLMLLMRKGGGGGGEGGWEGGGGA